LETDTVNWTTHDVGDGITIMSVVVGYAESNCYVFVSNSSKKAAIIDPGTSDPDQIAEIVAEVKRLGVTVEQIVNTHGHPDHMEGNDLLKTEFGAKVAIHELDGLKLTDPDRNASHLFGFDVQVAPADRLLIEGDEVVVGETVLKVLHTPGHSSGAITLLGNGYAFTGDTIFAGSVGRTDLPCSCDDSRVAWEVLMETLRERIMVLPDETILLPGHGPSTTIGHERSYNPYVK